MCIYICYNVQGSVAKYKKLNSMEEYGNIWKIYKTLKHEQHIQKTKKYEHIETYEHI